MAYPEQSKDGAANGKAANSAPQPGRIAPSDPGFKDLA